MKTFKNIYPSICAIENLMLAHAKARKRKTQRPYVAEFEKNLQENIKQLHTELITKTYTPRPLSVFMIRDPKMRKISASHYRDRVVHHAICNVIGPIFERQFISDSFANQKNKGTHRAILRYESMARKRDLRKGFVLKADIRHYFDTVDHRKLLDILAKRIQDPESLNLIERVLLNHNTSVPGKGMPIGNLTSQFFANVYLHELDVFVKHQLRAKHYIRYVDDFVIVDKSAAQLESWRDEISRFLQQQLLLELHPDKCRITPVSSGITLLGFRIFAKHRLLKKSNPRRIRRRLDYKIKALNQGLVSQEHLSLSLQGWLAYASFANTYHLRESVIRSIHQHTS